ncbi:MAG: DnaJ domain-containing protein [Alphaproteobacteria bacterium]|nr:DnaJ domain-containing protein [Alphaproteobacteria bacterium]
MLFVFGGFAILVGLLLLGYLFVNADPVRLARGLKWAAVGVAVLAIAALAISGRLAMLLAPIGLLIPAFGRLRSLFAGFRSPSTGRSSTVATPFLRMSLDHETGATTGTVLRGQLAGMRLEELGRAELVALLRECRAEDEEGARLLEAYLDRCHPDWRDDLAGAQAERPRPGGPDITIEEAYAILGLAPGADAEAVKAAHHRLMKKLHPDHGGSDYLATKINRARDVLLHR